MGNTKPNSKQENEKSDAIGNTIMVPLDETHPVVERGLSHQDVSPKCFQRGELNWAPQLQPSGQQISTCFALLTLILRKF